MKSKLWSSLFILGATLVLDIPEKESSIAGSWALDFTPDGQSILVNNPSTFSIGV